MIEIFRFSPSRLAFSYVALSVLVLALFAIPLWYAWSVNLSTFKEYVHGEDVQSMAEAFEREGAAGLATAIESRTTSYPSDAIVVLADASKARMAGNLPLWPAEVPDLPGTYGLVIKQSGSSMRVVASHVTLPGGYHLLIGRESARFQSLVDYFWFGIAAATAIMLVLGAVIGWLTRRALLLEVQQMSGTAKAIVEGDLSRRLATRRGPDALAALARTVNGMLEQLSTKNAQLAEEIGIRRKAEQALKQTHQDLERLVAQRTEQLQQSNESLRRSEAYLAEAQQLARVGSFGIKVETRELVCSEETMRIAAFEPGTQPTLEDALGRVHPEDRARVQATLEQALKNRSLMEYEHRLLRPDGSIRHVHVVAHTIQNASNASEFVGAVVDITKEKKSQDALRAAKARFEGIVDIAEDAILSVDGNQRIVLFNQGAEKVFGYNHEEVVGKSLDLLLPQRFAVVHRAHLDAFARSPDIARTMGQRREVFGMRKDGREFPAEASISKLDLGGELVFTVILRDVTERKRAGLVLAGEKRLLEVIAKGGSLATTLDALCRLAEEVDRDSLVSILLLDRKGEHFHHAAAPSVPADYMARIDGRRIGFGFGPCAAAAQLGEQVIASDIATDERWSGEYRELALAHGLRACWSTPIVAPDGTMLGTFAIYSHEPRSPTPEQRSRIEQLTHLASIAIERAQAMDALHRSEERYARAMDAAGDGHTEWIVATDEVYASPRFLEMCGFPPEITFRGHADFLARFPFHPEDRDRVIDSLNTNFASETARLELEMRILRKDEIRWHHLTGLCSRDTTGALVRWNAAVTDITDRKLAEEALRRSEEGYALAMEASGEGHWDWNIVTDEYHASPRMLELYGFPPATTFMGRADFVARFPFHPEDRPRWEKAIAAHFAGETARFDIEIRMIPHGETRWIHLTGLLSRDAAGKPVRWTGSVADITERKCAEDALRLSEQRYALAMEATRDGHWDWDIPSDKIYVSPLLLDICGLPHDITFASAAEWADRFPYYPGERARYEHAVAEHFAGKTERLDVDLRIVPRGETRWVHITGRCSRDASGRPVRWAGSVTDITGRKRVAEELRARQDMLDLAQNAARAVAFEWKVGAGEGENRWSPDLEAMYGIPPGSYDGTYESWKDLVYPEDWPKVRAAIEAAQESGDVAAEYRVIHRGGAIRWLQAKGRMFFDQKGKPTRVVGFMLDVTDRRLAEEELQRMEQQLRQAQRLEAMGTLAGGIAHDFNNLLGAILGYGEMALRDAPAGSRLRRDVESIMIAGERGRALVDRILAFSRSGVGERIAVHVEEVVRETLALFAAKLPRRIVIEQRLDVGGAAVMGDPTQIHQVLMNLATNAVQAMPSGGTLRVSLERVRVREARAATTGTVTPRDYLVLDVTDTGLGIEPKIREKIFDPFFTTKEVGVGSGLGLSLVHGIATGLNGAIDVATAVGRGSSFKVYLPLAGEVGTLIKPARTAQPETRFAGHGHVLVVDDEEALVRLLTHTLTELGYTAAGFTASATALAAFLADPSQFDAIITDESMPGTSGSELIRKMRAIRPTIPILLVSGYLSTSVVELARQAGASEVLKKPLSARQLATALDRVLKATRDTNAEDLAPSTSPPPAKRRRRAAASASRARSARR